MADEEDLKALERREPDQVGRDLRGAEFSNRILVGFDFSKARLEKSTANSTDFSDSILKQAKLTGMKARQSRFRNVEAPSTVFFNNDFTGADFSGANLAGSHFQSVNFSGADLRGANFANAHLKEGCVFNECIVDETTRFDGVEVFRPLARHETFKFYRVERGRLVRREPDTMAEMPLVRTTGGFDRDLVAAIDGALTALSSVASRTEFSTLEPGIGHNRLPASPLSQHEYEEL